MSYKFGNTKRPKEHGLLIAIKKSINNNCKALDIPKEDFAKELGTTHGVLENKLKMSSFTNDVTLSEFIHIMEITGDYGPLKYLCEMFGFVMTSSESGESISIDQLNNLTDEAQIEQNESFSVTKRALKDRRVTVCEKKEMLREGMEAIEALKRQIDAVKLIKTTEEEE